eukprot:jgi/Hompol1/2551/HPOL_006073-RA
MLLPTGFPHSVSDDYCEYQIFDTLQAFCSSVTGLLATQASFRRAGVGDATATATAATLVWVLQDGTGMIGRILFIWGVSARLDTEVKTWRFAADLFNDGGMLVEMIAPLAPQALSLMLVCTAAVLRSLCGVAGGATKAALSQHFAIRDNMADLNAKDGSQETLISLVGMLIGSQVLRTVSDAGMLTVWIVFATFTLLHLYCNYRAVRAIVIPVLNEQRAFRVISEYIESGSTTVLTPKQVSARESLFWSPRVKFGVSLTQIMRHSGNISAIQNCAPVF